MEPQLKLLVEKAILELRSHCSCEKQYEFISVAVVLSPSSSASLNNRPELKGRLMNSFINITSSSGAVLTASMNYLNYP